MRESDFVHGCTYFAERRMRESDFVHGCTYFAERRMRESDEAAIHLVHIG